jgi:hypothetical protein
MEKTRFSTLARGRATRRGGVNRVPYYLVTRIAARYEIAIFGVSDRASRRARHLAQTPP